MRASRVQVGKETSTKRELIRDTAIEAQENLGQKAHKTRGNKSKKQKWGTKAKYALFCKYLLSK